MLHASHDILIRSAVDGHDSGVEVRECCQEFLLRLIHLAIDVVVAIGAPKVAVLPHRCMVAEAQPPVLALVGHRVLMIPCRTAYEVEWDVLDFFNRHVTYI